MQIRRGRLQTLNDFQRLLEDISYLWSTIWISPNKLNHLLKTLESEKELKSPRIVSAETERELAERENTEITCESCGSES